MSRTERQAAERDNPLLRSGPAFVLLVLVSFAYNWYYLGAGFQADDYFFLNMMRQDPVPYSRWLGFWAVNDFPALSNSWWYEGGDLGVFWRPFPSLLFEGSVWAFGEHAFPLHLLSVLVHGLVGGTLFLLVRRLTGQLLVAVFAGLFFLSCEDHSMGVGWISTVTDLVCVLFVNLALLAHARWLERRQPWALVAALAALVPALLSKESAVVAPLGIVLMTALLPRGRDEDLSRPTAASVRTAAGGLLRDWISWVPAVALLAVYLVIYKLLGFGGISSGMYIDPFSQPARYVVHLFAHLPVMWLATLSPVPPSIAMFIPATVALLAAAGAVVFVVWVAGLWPQRRRGLVVWAMALYLLALLPQMSTDASERCLYFPAIGSSILLALLLVQIGPIARRIAPAETLAPRFTRIVGWGALVCVLVPGIVLSAAMPFALRPSFAKLERQVVSALPHVEARNPDTLILLNTPGFFQAFYPPTIVEYHVRRPIDVRVLSAVNGVVSLERVGERSFVLRTDREGWLTSMFAGLLRPAGPPKPGRIHEKGVLTATIQEMLPSGRDVAAVRFDMHRPLDAPGVLFAQWDGRTFRPIDLAALPIGEVVILADTSDVWGSM